MRLSVFFTALVLFLVGFSFVYLRAQSQGDSVEVPNLFSYLAPKGWMVQNSPEDGHPVAFEPNKVQFAPNISFITVRPPTSMDEGVEACKAAFKNSERIKEASFSDQKPFQTASGAKGVRLVVHDTIQGIRLQQILYFFDASAAGLVFTGSCHIEDVSHYTPIFDSSLSTFSFK